MELNQKFTFARKNSKYVASPLRDDLPVHRITLRAQDRYPALRVTEINFLFRFNRFFRRCAMKIAKKIETIEFFKFSKFCHFFPKFFENFVRIFALAIIYREVRRCTQKIRHNLLFPEMTSNQNLNGWSSVKNSNFY